MRKWDYNFHGFTRFLEFYDNIDIICYYAVHTIYGNHLYLIQLKNPMDSWSLRRFLKDIKKNNVESRNFLDPVLAKHES